jgi:hypothetical protein
LTPATPGWETFVVAVTPYVAEAAFFAGVAFIAAYTLLAKWWKTPVGVSIVLLDLMIALILLPDMLLYLLDINVTGSEFWTFLVLGALAAVPVIIMWRLVILVRLQLRGRDGE